MLLGVGVAGLAAGGGLYGVARNWEREAPDAPSESQYRDTIDRASTMGTAGIVVLAIGGASLIGAIVRYSIVASKERKPTRTAWGPGSVTVRF